MAVNGKYSKEQLDRIKKQIGAFYRIFKPNYDRYHEFRKFVFDSSLSDKMKAVLKEQGKPDLEFNIVEAFISRLLGEFAKHEPSIEVTPSDGVPVDHKTIEIVEGHIRHIIYESNKNSCSYEVYKDLLSGGFSVIKVWTDYASPMSFNQVIKVGRVFDPTLTGFDILARASHKGDGNHCFELFPKTKEDAEREYPGLDLTNVSYTRDMEGYNWSYETDMGEEILLFCNWFEKKWKRQRIVKLANGRVLTEKNYQKLEAYWKEQGFIQQLPVVVGKPRWTDIPTICNYKLIESEIFEYTETDYNYLPLIFVDGNSIILRKDSSTNTQQMTKPYVYNARGIQNLKNYAGQSLGSYLENIVQHKFIIKKEALPQEEDYLDAIDNHQQASTIVVNAYSDNDPNKPIPEPIREVVHPQAPPEIMNTFTVSDQITQAVLGNYDASLGINDNQLSGVAIIEAATQSNAAAMPYVVGYLQAWSQLANIVVDLIPKYYVTPRTIPVVGMDGEKSFVKINGDNQPTVNYDDNALEVNVEAGLNFQLQKNKALMQIVALMNASPQFAEFMNDAGLKVLVKNLTVYGADELQGMADDWLQKKTMQQQQAQQMAMMNNPAMIKAKTDLQKSQIEAQSEQQKQMLDAEKAQQENQIEIARLAIEKQNADTDTIIAMNEVQQAKVNASVQLEKSNTERFVHALDAADRLDRLKHDKLMDHHDSIRKSAELHHSMNMTEKENTNVNA